MAGARDREPEGGARPSAEDCRSCGACCVAEFPSPFYVGVSAADLARLEARWRARHVSHGSILTKVDPRGRCVCVALRGTTGRRVSCSIYERRPEECRRLEAGSPECLRARRQIGLEAGTRPSVHLAPLAR